MKTAKLTTTIRTFFEDGTYRNNSVELTIPEEAARIIVDAWELKGGALPVHESCRGLYLARNQNASVYIELESEPKPCGISGMCAEEGCEDTFTYKDMGEKIFSCPPYDPTK